MDGPTTIDDAPPLPPAAVPVSLRTVYEESCHAQGCRPNTSLLRLLPGPGAESELRSIDLGSNFVGVVGVRAVLDVVRAAPCLEHLSLRDNYLDNAAAAEVIRSIDGHPSLRSVDLSHNPVSQAAGRLLLPLLRRNAALRSVALGGTLVTGALAAAVHRLAEANAALPPPPPPDPAAQATAAPRRSYRGRRGLPPATAPAIIPQPPQDKTCHRAGDEDGVESPTAAIDADPADVLLAFAVDREVGQGACPYLATLLGAFDT